jgi:hypothetical protein
MIAVVMTVDTAWNDLPALDKILWCCCIKSNFEMDPFLAVVSMRGDGAKTD